MNNSSTKPYCELCTEYGHTEEIHKDDDHSKLRVSNNKSLLDLEGCDICHWDSNDPNDIELCELHKDDYQSTVDELRISNTIRNDKPEVGILGMAKTISESGSLLEDRINDGLFLQMMKDFISGSSFVSIEDLTLDYFEGKISVSELRKVLLNYLVDCFRLGD